MSRHRRKLADTSAGMGGTRRASVMCVAFAAVVLGGCGRPAADAPPAPDDLSSLPRDGITTAQRVQWRDHLRWPDDCEDAFRASASGGDYGGVLVFRLAGGASLVEVTCAAGSYQPSALRYKLVEDRTGTHVVALVFPVYGTDDGEQPTLSEAAEVWGEAAVDVTTGEIAILSLGRQTADCGVWARYSLAGDQPGLVAAAARVRCPESPGPPARLSASSPPPGWAPIPRKD